MNAKIIKRVFIILLILFAVIFTCCFIYQITDNISYWDNSPLYPSYSYSYLSSSMEYNMHGYDYEYGLSKSARNYASENQIISSDKGAEINYDQKYEMISSITAVSENFESDSNILRKTISDLSGVIQMENMSGLEEEHNRRLWVSIGITPGKFDLLTEKVKEIGTITGFSVNKTDKTVEFRSYLAQREGLEKTLASYISLKSQAGEISDLLALEEKIIETEKEILEMGVTLGVYDESQSMCTVDFTLGEYIEYNGGGKLSALDVISLIANSAAEAFPWTMLIYVLMLLFIVGTGFSALGIAFVLNRITKQPSEKGD